MKDKEPSTGEVEPAFDPDAFLASEAPAFDPDAFLAEHEAEPVVTPAAAAPPAEKGALRRFLEYEIPAPASVVAGVKGFTRGATMGLSPRILAALEGSTLEEQRQREEAAREAAPWTYGGAQLAGTVAGVGKFAKAAGIGAGLRGAVGLGAGAGVIQGAAESPGDLMSGQSALEAAKGGAIGAVTGGLGYGLLAGAGRIGRGLAPASLREWAARRAIRAGGPMLKDIRELEFQGKLEDVGKTLLDKRIVRFGSKAEDVAERAGAALKESGEKIGALMSRAEASASAAERLGPGAVADRIEREVVRPMLASPARAGFTGKLQEFVERLREAKPGGKVSVRTMDTWRQEMDDLLNWTARQGESPEAVKAARRIVNDEVMRAITATSQRTGLPLVQELTKEKQLYGHLAPVARFAEDKVARELANRSVTPSTYGVGLATGAGALAAGGTTAEAGAKAMLAGFANKLLMQRGSSAMAVTAERAAGLMERMPLVMRLARTNPAALGKYAGPLVGAMRSGDSSRTAATHYMLSQTDEEYRSLMKQLGDEGGGENPAPETR